MPLFKFGILKDKDTMYTVWGIVFDKHTFLIDYEILFCRFMVNRRIFVVGFGLYGSIHGPTEYSVNIQVNMKMLFCLKAPYSSKMDILLSKSLSLSAHLQCHH